MHYYKKPISGNKQDDRQRRNSAFTDTTSKVYVVATSIPIVMSQRQQSIITYCEV